MKLMMAIGWSSIMILLGVALRAKLPFWRRMLVPASVTAGLLGVVFMNVMSSLGIDIGTDFSMFSDVVTHLFTISFISISLTSSPRGTKVTNVLKGASGMGLVWCLLYALTPIVGALIIMLIGGAFGMDPIYGILVPFAFCQGPGQSASYGALFEQYGWENAAMVAVTFAAIGFVVAFAVGIPAAKLGIKRGIAKHSEPLSDTVMRGYLTETEQTDSMQKDTMCTSNLETLAFHVAIIGLCYVLAVGISKLLALIPGFFGSSMSGMMFMNGMYAAYIVKFVMKKLKIDYLLDNTLQSKITGWSADYLVVCAFMAISLQIISNWLVPIGVVSVMVTLVTFIVCFFFGQRFGGENDFERTLAMYGTCTGTVPTGVALVRIVDPNFHTTTSVEIGASNLIMMASTPVVLVMMACASGALSLTTTLIIFAACTALYTVLLKVFRLWGKKSFSWKK